jgi:hypothetical protein
MFRKMRDAFKGGAHSVPLSNKQQSKIRQKAEEKVKEVRKAQWPYALPQPPLQMSDPETRAWAQDAITTRQSTHVFIRNQATGVAIGIDLVNGDVVEFHHYTDAQLSAAIPLRQFRIQD